MHKLIPFLISLSLLGSALVQGEDVTDYRLGPEDLIQVEVLNVEGYKHDVRLSNTGDILLPHLGQVAAAGKTTSELAADLTALMKDTLFRDPTVSVTVKEYKSSPILLIGAVQTPGVYQKVTSDYKLIDLLSEAGGVMDSAGDTIKIQRRDEEGPGKAIELAMSDLYGARLSTLNFALEAGDVVTIPPRETHNPDVYFVIGEVGKPGDYSFPKDRDLLVTQAISAAGGPLKTAKVDKGMLVRYNQDGTEARIPFNFKKMLRGQEPDVKIQPQDIVFLPGSNAKTIMYGLLGVIPNTAQQATTTTLRRP